MNLNGTVINVLVHNMLPYATVTKTHSPAIKGFLGDIWDILQEHLNFTSKIRGIDYEQALELIDSNQADVMLASAVANNVHQKNVEFSQPYFYNWYHLYIKYPERAPSPTFYFQTLAQEVWFASLIFFVIFTITIWLTIKIFKSYGITESSASLYCCFMSIIAGFLNQGFDLKLKRTASRLQLMAALLFGMILYSSMNALLVSKLANFEINMPFKTLEDIATKKSHSLCVRTNSFVYNNFTHANGSLLTKWEGIVNGPRCLDIINQTNLAEVLCRNNVVVLENRVVMANIKITFQLDCEILNTHHRYFGMGNYIVFSKSFKHKKIIGNMIRRLRNYGILRYLEYKWFDKPQLFNANKTPVFYQVTIEHVLAVLSFYGAVVFLCLLLLVFENLCVRCNVINNLFVLTINFYQRAKP